VSDGPVVPGDLDGVARLAARVGELAAELRTAASRQVGQLRGLEGWAGPAHDQWEASAELTCRAAVGIAATLDETVRVLGWFGRSVTDLRVRAAAVAARARVACLDVGPEGEVRPVGVVLPATLAIGGLDGRMPRGAGAGQRARAGSRLPVAGPAVPVGGPASPVVGPDAVGARWQVEVAGRRLAAQPDPWRAVQLEVTALVEDALTVYAATVAGLRAVADDYGRVSVAPPSPLSPDGGGFPLEPVTAAVTLAQLPRAREDLRALRAGADPRRLPRPAGAAASPEPVLAVLRARRLGRGARLAAATCALDRVVAAAGRVPVLPAVASYPVGRLVASRSTGVVARVPVVNVVLAGYAVRDDVSAGYSVPAAVGREGAVVVAGVAAAEGAGILLVTLGGPAVLAAVVAVGVGMVAAEIVGRLYDSASRHD